MTQRLDLPESIRSLCAVCLRTVDAHTVVRDGAVFLNKNCPEHGLAEVLLSSDAAYYALCRGMAHAGQRPLQTNTPVEYGCPYDCGLCAGHEQHSCLAVLEITDRCNLTCPVCFAESSPQRTQHRSLAQIEFMLDALVRNEGEPDVVQISGGEPTLHPDFFAVLDAAKRRPIKHLMLNTNGIRIADDAAFARRLSEYAPGFEIYLQFDSLKESALRDLRGADLRLVRQRALERLNALNLSTTLVVTLKKGVNDNEMGAILDFALQQPCVRGITFQPVQDAGRNENFDPTRDRLTLGEVRRNLIAQHSLFSAEDVVPVPCHPDCIAMAYALKLDGKAVALTRHIGGEALLQGGGSITYEKNGPLKKRVFDLFSREGSKPGPAHALAQLLCCLPAVNVPPALNYANVFRVMIVQFLDAHNFDVRAVKRSCIHILHPDGRVIPFDTYNLFYREGREDVLRRLRAEVLESRK